MIVPYATLYSLLYHPYDDTIHTTVPRVFTSIWRRFQSWHANVKLLCANMLCHFPINGTNRFLTVRKARGKAQGERLGVGMGEGEILPLMRFGFVIETGSHLVGCTQLRPLVAKRMQVKWAKGGEGRAQGVCCAWLVHSPQVTPIYRPLGHTRNVLDRPQERITH